MTDQVGMLFDELDVGEEIARAAAAQLAKELPLLDLVREEFAEQVRREAPQRMERLASLGWFGLGLPGDVGGVDLDAVAEVHLVREMGRYLVPLDALAQLVASRVAYDAGSDLCEPLVSGRIRAAWAVRAHGTDDELIVLAGRSAQAYLVTDGAGFLLTDGAAVELRVEDAPGIDPYVDVDRGVLSPAAAAAAAWGSPATLARCDLYLAAYLAGMAQATLDQAVAYAKVRRQFGAPIGSFQAVKHRCADMAVGAHASWATTLQAAQLCAAQDPAWAGHAMAAHIVAAQAAAANSRSDVQVHGAMGFTNDAGCHLYVRRVRVLRELLGGPARLLEDFLAPAVDHGM